jgi:NADPH:quinone reductase-like Zn-dependent oxidoreductase
VFDTRGGDTQLKSIEVLKQGGILVSTVGIKDKEALKPKNIEGVAYMAQSVPNDLKQIGEMVDAGKVKAIIAKVLPLKDIIQAHKLSEEGHTRGKIVLTLGE